MAARKTPAKKTAAKKTAARKIPRARALKRIMVGVACGRAVDAIVAADSRMPSADTFWRWHWQDEKIRDALARARECGAEVHVGEIVPIADELGDNAASRRVRIDARVKASQMAAPGKYGARGDPAGGGDHFAVAEEVEAARRRMPEQNDE